MWAGAPWMLGQLARASGLAPFVPSGQTAPGLVRSALGVGVITALVATVLPVAGLVLVFMALALALGGLIAGSPRGSVSMMLVSVLGAAVAFILHVPWSLDYVLPGAELASFVGADTGTRSLDVIDLIGLRTQSSTVGVLGLGVVIAGGLALVIGRGWRLDWAARGWSLMLCGVGAALVADRGLLPFTMPPAEVLLAPSCAGLALAVGLGVAAFERDLSAYRFGWRQLAAGVAGASLVIGSVPVLIASLGGTWSVPGGDYNEILAFIEAERADTPFRVLWLGQPDVLPLGSYELEQGLAYATTDHGLPELGDAIVTADPGSAELVADGLDLVLAGETTRFGQLMAPLGIRYVVVVDQLAPAPFDDDPRPTPQELLPALSAQLDLEVIDVNPALTVFRTDEAIPLRAEVDEQFGAGATSITDVGADLGAATPVLVNESDRTSFDGPVEAGTRVFWSATASDNWALSVDGQPVIGEEAFGFATAYEVGATGEAELVFETPVFRYGMLVVQALLWLFVLRTLLRMRLAPERDGSSA